MLNTKTEPKLEAAVREFVRRDFHPRYGELRDRFDTDERWCRLRDIGTELWLDTGDIDDIRTLWTREFTALTTNNTLLNKEIQKGTYDRVIPEAARLIDENASLPPHRKRLELAFLLNALHGLKLVETFDAYVSVEEHTDLANDLDGTVEYARRYHEICPARFIVKIPLSPAGVLATRKLSREGIPINHTLGFSARQNYVIARIGRPQFVNVFLGRLNSFVADNELGDGTYVGERTVLASQRVVRGLRESHGVPSRQIGASLRGPEQIRDLAGLDVMTMPPKAAKGFLDLDLPEEELADATGRDYTPGIAESTDPQSVRLETLWDVSDELVACVDALDQENLDAFTPEDLVAFFVARGVGDLFVPWTDEQIATSAEEGKIPRLANWKEPLAHRKIGLDALMNLAGYNSFSADQTAMDERVLKVIAESR